MRYSARLPAIWFVFAILGPSAFAAAPAGTSGPVSKSERYKRLRPVDFAKPARSWTAKAFEGSVTSLFMTLPARGPMVSVDAASSVANVALEVARLEQDVGRGLLRRTVRARGNALVATYRAPDDREGRRVRVTMARGPAGARALEVRTLGDGLVAGEGWDRVIAEIGWTPAARTLDTYHSVDRGVGARFNERTSGGVTRGRIERDRVGSQVVNYTVDRRGERRGNTPDGPR